MGESLKDSIFFYGASRNILIKHMLRFLIVHNTHVLELPDGSVECVSSDFSKEMSFRHPPNDVAMDIQRIPKNVHSI